jgi:RHS repeat-associated protein
VGEYNGTGGALIRRYVHGAGVDEPLVWYECATLGDRRWLHADERGSVLASSDGAAAATPYRYGPYGEPDSWSGSRFKYTGQIALPEAQLYHYKARVYDPVLGRFLQTDPVGYDDDFNLYAYVGNDPINRADPTGAYGRDGSWNNYDWRRFNKAQRQAAKAAERAANRLDRAAAQLAGGQKRSASSRRTINEFESATGQGNGTAANLSQAASDFRDSATALRDDGTKGYMATSYTAAQFAAAGASAGAFMRAAIGGKTVEVNIQHAAFTDSVLTKWSIGHESLHSAGLRHQLLNNVIPYRWGDSAQQNAFTQLPIVDPARARVNPDNLVDFAQ